MKKLFLLTAIVLGVVLGASLPTTHASSKNPRIVAQPVFLAQTGAMSAQTVFTPSVEGDYRISVYAPSHNAGGNSGLNLIVSASWSDTVTSRIFSGAPASGNLGCCVAQNFVEFTIPIHVTSSPITIQANSNAPDVYDVYVTVEEL